MMRPSAVAPKSNSFCHGNWWPMIFFAMPPPLALGNKLFVALLTLFLSGVLVCARKRKLPTVRLQVLALILTVVILCSLEAFLTPSFGAGFHDRGILAGVTGFLVGLALLRPKDDRAPKN